MKDIQVGIIVKTDTFKIGDLISNLKNFKNGLDMFWRATDGDLEYINHQRKYLKIIFGESEEEVVGEVIRTTNISNGDVMTNAEDCENGRGIFWRASEGDVSYCDGEEEYFKLVIDEGKL